MNFLEQRNRDLYCKITSLDINEFPQESFEGKISAGSVNVDGASAVRRTCQLTILTEDVNLSNYFWSLNTKFKLEVGMKNEFTQEITWFNQGIYIITSFSQSLANNNHSFNISGKDKMCMLNGENGGALPFEVDFGKYEEIDENGILTIKEYPIKEIIREAVHHYGQEPFHNIIINDLDETGLILQEYRYNTPLYLIRKSNEQNGAYTTMTLDGEIPIYIQGKVAKLSEIPVYDSLVELEADNLIEPTEFKFFQTSEACCAAKIEYGQTVGYIETELVYAGDLIGAVGESITSILDKITKMLGNYEYFYNVDGQFIFQKKKTYVNSPWTPLKNVDGVTYVDSSSEKFSYSFINSELFSAFNNSPNITNLKNDYSVWGARKSSSGAEIPIHLRYAIDTKPQFYKTIQVEDNELQSYNDYYGTYLTGQNSKIFLTEEILDDDTNYYDLYEKNLILNTIKAQYDQENKTIKIESGANYLQSDLAIEIDGEFLAVYIVKDWREIIYQMAKDYRKYNHLKNFQAKIKEANPTFYPTGYTGYEQYYVDLEGFWRQLFCPEQTYILTTPTKETLSSCYELVQTYTPISGDRINGEELYIKTIIPPDNIEKYIRVNFYSSSAEQDQVNSVKQYYRLEKYYKACTDQEIIQGKKYYRKSEDYYPANHENAFWNKNVYENPDKINFWFDFLDSNSELNKFNVKSIGVRGKPVNDSEVKSIYNRKTPYVIFYSATPNRQKEGYYYIQVSEDLMKQLFSSSSQGKSAKDALDELLYRHAYCIESVSITSIPIYTLTPNSLIYIEDEERGIKGEYLLSKYTIPFAYNGTMNITATKAINRIF